MVCNPVVVDRVRVGHVAFCSRNGHVCSGCTPRCWRRVVSGNGSQVRPALWFALAISVSPHAAWLGIVVVLAVAVLPRPSWRDLVRSAQVTLSAGLVYLRPRAVVDEHASPACDGRGSRGVRDPCGSRRLPPTVATPWLLAHRRRDTVRDWLGPGFGMLVAVLLAVAVVAGYGAMEGGVRQGDAPDCR